METQDLEKRISELEDELKAVLLIAVGVVQVANNGLPGRDEVKKAIGKFPTPDLKETLGDPKTLAQGYVDKLWPKPTNPGYEIASSR